MDVVFDLAAAPRPARGTAVTIGAYDGVHLGHQAVLRELRRRADEKGLETVVVTFDRHPATIVRPQSAPKLITDLDQKLDALAATGSVDRTVVVRFDQARSQEEPEDFVQEVLVDGLDARLVVVGEDFHFGRARRGNVALLREMGRFEVVGLGLVRLPDGVGPVSSTAIRALVGVGDVQGAARLLGRLFEVRGVVTSGDRRGRSLLGYPTANISVLPELLLPGLGIYAGWYERPSGDVRPAAISMGRRPTFHRADAVPVLEAFVLDFEGDLYDEAALVRFVTRLRDEQHFDTPAALVAQMARDVEQTRAVLAATRAP